VSLDVPLLFDVLLFDVLLFDVLLPLFAIILY
jgi:hypothetical protein